MARRRRVVVTARLERLLANMAVAKPVEKIPVRVRPVLSFDKLRSQTRIHSRLSRLAPSRNGHPVKGEVHLLPQREPIRPRSYHDDGGTGHDRWTTVSPSPKKWAKMLKSWSRNERVYRWVETEGEDGLFRMSRELVELRPMPHKRGSWKRIDRRRRRFKNSYSRKNVRRRRREKVEFRQQTAEAFSQWIDYQVDFETSLFEAMFEEE